MQLVELLTDDDCEITADDLLENITGRSISEEDARSKEKLLSGGEREIYYTIDDDILELEQALTAGGASETEYEIHQLVECEVIDN